MSFFTTINENYVNKLSIWTAYYIFGLAYIFVKMLAVRLPEDFVGWLSVIAKFIILFAFLFGIQYFITVLAWNKSNKIQ
ncbi:MULTISPECIES: hypothetical protein [Bacillus cereus group]|uniref:hypothetical protein n=1 Tax=Bacillus cereus group TaxID=86661 RepID=UPI001F5825D2|nr:MULTISPECIES: hypothetical protein [Bacillus cereus group]MED0963117.1 hypothetical protein [Bacillus paramycoides]